MEHAIEGGGDSAKANEELKDLVAEEVQRIMGKKLAEVEEKHVRPVDHLAKGLVRSLVSSPFSTKIMTKEMPRKFEVPKLKAFDGTQDPADHILNFRQAMALHEGNDALLCWIFPTSLSGTALIWFHHLPAGEINSFEDMARRFIFHYLANKKEAKGVDCLFQFRKKEGESVKDYSERFRKVSSQLEKCEETVLIASFKNGLPKDHDLFRSLVKGQPKTIHEMLQRVRTYLLLEEVVGAPSLERKQTSKSQAVETKGFKKPRFERKVILPRVVNQEVRPRATKSPSIRDGHVVINKLCVLHKIYGRTTRECRTIKAQVREMIRDGELKEAIAEERVRLQEKLPKGKNSDLPIISVITAATSIYGLSNNQRRIWPA